MAERDNTVQLRDPSKEKKRMREFRNSIMNVILVILVLWIAFTFFLGLKMAPNDDMKPRISAGDLLLYYRVDKLVDPQDIVIVKKNKTEYVGRVVATSGDKVDIGKSGLLINDIPVSEDNIYYDTIPYEGFVEYPVTMKDDECFVLADYRRGGEDSRYYGVVTKDEIKGTVIGQFRRAGI